MNSAEQQYHANEGANFGGVPLVDQEAYTRRLCLAHVQLVKEFSGVVVDAMRRYPSEVRCIASGISLMQAFCDDEHTEVKWTEAGGTHQSLLREGLPQILARACIDHGSDHAIRASALTALSHFLPAPHQMIRLTQQQLDRVCAQLEGLPNSSVPEELLIELQGAVHRLQEPLECSILRCFLTDQERPAACSALTSLLHLGFNVSPAIVDALIGCAHGFSVRVSNIYPSCNWYVLGLGDCCGTRFRVTTPHYTVGRAALEANGNSARVLCFRL